MSVTQTSFSSTWFDRFLIAIDLPGVTVPADFCQRFSETIQGSGIYIENLRSLLGTSTPVAKALLDVATSQGLLKRCVLLLCPGPRCARGLLEIPADEAASPDQMLHCDACEGMEQDPFEFPASDCQRLDVYQVQETATGESI